MTDNKRTKTNYKSMWTKRSFKKVLSIRKSDHNYTALLKFSMNFNTIFIKSITQKIKKNKKLCTSSEHTVIYNTFSLTQIFTHVYPSQVFSNIIGWNNCHPIYFVLVQKFFFIFEYFVIKCFYEHLYSMFFVSSWSRNYGGIQYNH